MCDESATMVYGRTKDAGAAMRHKRGQPEIKLWARSRANAKATAGSNSITSTATSTGVIFDIANILSGRPVTARISTVTPALGRKPPLRNRGFLLRGPYDRHLHLRALGLGFALGTRRE